MMLWRKVGCIFAPDRTYPWMWSHASNPVAVPLTGDLVRILFSCRDQHRRSSVGYVDVDLNHPNHPLAVSDQPVLQPGEPGTFDDCGVSLGHCVEFDNRRFLYYMGWNLSTTVPWRNAIGLAVAEAGSTGFRRWSNAPILDRGPGDAFSLSYPAVLHREGVWHMWYGSHVSWGAECHEDTFSHAIRYARSSDGLHWHRTDGYAIPLNGSGERALSRPTVQVDGGTWRMWYARRGAAYRLGYAESADGIHWTRKDDEAGIDVSPTGWDSEMIAYPCVFDHRGTRFLLYNGNGYGATGFGLAILEKGSPPL
jgi:hypothetical protein